MPQNNEAAYQAPRERGTPSNIHIYMFCFHITYCHLNIIETIHLKEKKHLYSVGKNLALFCRAEYKDKKWCQAG